MIITTRTSQLKNCALQRQTHHNSCIITTRASQTVSSAAQHARPVSHADAYHPPCRMPMHIIRRVACRCTSSAASHADAYQLPRRMPMHIIRCVACRCISAAASHADAYHLPLRMPMSSLSGPIWSGISQSARPSRHYADLSAQACHSAPPLRLWRK
jgi:hypothetical protein